MRSSYSMDLRLQFDCRPAGKEDWDARCRSVPGVSTFGMTKDAALRSAASVALRVVAELVTKGDPRWSQFKDVDS